MIRRIQNIVAESRVTLPVTVVYAVAIWLLTGLLKEQWWIQFVCFAASVALMMELNNQNLLIRVFSRMVSSIYIVLTCTAVFLFPSLSGAILQLCTIAALCLLYHTYQDKASMGWIYFAFLCVGLGSLMDIHMFWYVPLLWVIMT
jgi:thiol:disulfide interchange protein